MHRSQNGPRSIPSVGSTTMSALDMSLEEIAAKGRKERGTKGQSRGRGRGGHGNDRGIQRNTQGQNRQGSQQRRGGGRFQKPNRGSKTGPYSRVCFNANVNH